MSQIYSTIPVESRPIDQFPKYRIGINGTVWSCWAGNGTWRQMKPQLHGRGYPAVAAIRTARKHLTLQALSDQYGVSKATISSICLRRCWTHI